MGLWIQHNDPVRVGPFVARLAEIVRHPGAWRRKVLVAEDNLRLRHAERVWEPNLSVEFVIQAHTDGARVKARRSAHIVRDVWWRDANT